MVETGCLVIDDVKPSLAAMTDLGRDAASAATDGIRSAVLAFAVLRNWYVMPHAAYVEWASEKIRLSTWPWFVLDPLFPISDLGDRVQSFRLTRRFDNNRTVTVRQHVLSGATLDPFGDRNGVGIVDDAAASGGTLRIMSRLITNLGGSVAHILVAAASASARHSLLTQAPSAKWAAFIRGDWKVVHLRDGCPHLPHSGRPTEQPPTSGLDGSNVESRVLSSSVSGNAWQVLYMDPAVRRAATSARIEIVRRFSTSLGRPARVRDLTLLGSSVPVVVEPGEVVTGNTTLASLIHAASV